MPLEIINYTFKESISNTYLDDTIDIEFNTSLDPATVNANTVFLYTLPNTIRQAVNLEIVGSTVLKISGNPILINESDFQLIIAGRTNGVKGTGLEELDGNFVQEFTTVNSLKPEQTESPEDVADAIIDINEVNNKDITVVIPDVSLQGSIKPYIPCEPTASTSTLPEVIPTVDSGLPSGTVGLFLTGSIPDRYDIGVTDISEISTTWSDNIVGNVTVPMKLSYQDIGVGYDPFTSTELPSLSPTIIIDDRVTQDYANMVTTNKEYTILVKIANLKTIDGLRVNKTEKVIFSGPLEPILCTFEQVVANAGKWDTDFTKEDIYYYYKVIHAESTAAILADGWANIGEVPTKNLMRLAKYVCCNVALNMIVYGSPSATSGTSSSNAFGTYIKKRDLPGVSITYDTLSGGSTSSGTTPQTAKINQLLDCIKNNAPKDIKQLQDDGLGPIVISHGIKSNRDPSKPIRRRL